MGLPPPQCSGDVAAFTTSFSRPDAYPVYRVYTWTTSLDGADIPHILSLDEKAIPNFHPPQWDVLTKSFNFSIPLEQVLCFFQLY